MTNASHLVTIVRPDFADVTNVRPDVTDVRPHVTNASPAVTIVRPDFADVTDVRPHVTDVRPHVTNVRPHVAARARHRSWGNLDPVRDHLAGAGELQTPSGRRAGEPETCWGTSHPVVGA
ncbi:MAG TPA: hypothetical protein VFC82_03765 [Actinomycetaceae bacterium]|nr:hypothetical protein [Actinomycetaceae bacterium]